MLFSNILILKKCDISVAKLRKISETWMMLVYFNLYYKVELKAHAVHKNRKERYLRKESTTLPILPITYKLSRINISINSLFCQCHTDSPNFGLAVSRLYRILVRR